MMKVSELNEALRRREQELRFIYEKTLKEYEKSLRNIFKSVSETFKRDMENFVKLFRSETERLRNELKRETRIERWKYLLMGLLSGLLIGTGIGAIGVWKLRAPAPVYYKVVQDEGETWLLPYELKEGKLRRISE